MQGISGYIEYDSDGRPYMGLIVEAESVQVKIFLARKENAITRARLFGVEIERLANELVKTEDRIVPVVGDVSDIRSHNATVRKRKG